MSLSVRSPSIHQPTTTSSNNSSNFHQNTMQQQTSDSLSTPPGQEMAPNTPSRVFSSQDTSPLSSAPSTIVPPSQDMVPTSDTATITCTPGGDTARIASPSDTSDSSGHAPRDGSSHKASALPMDSPPAEDTMGPKALIYSSDSMPEMQAPHSTSKHSRDDTDDKGVDEEDAPPPKNAATSKSKGKAKAKAKPAPRKPIAKKATRPPPPPSTRPSRNRKAPERFADIEETKEAEPLKQLPMKKGASKVFDPVYITTNSTSRLGKADVYHMLLEPAAWTSLSTEQQAKLVSMLPQSSANIELLARIRGASGKSDSADTRPHAFTMSNDCFRTDVAKFKEDLKNGHLAKTWQASAQQAVIDRAAGVYDDWKAEETESWWGQKSSGG